MYQARLNSFNELPKEKRPPRYMWDRPYELSQYLEHIWDKDGAEKEKTSYNIDFEEME